MSEESKKKASALETFSDFVKRNWYATLLMILSIGGFGWAVVLIGQIGEMVLEYPFPLIVCMVIAFLLGLIVSSLIGLNKRSMKKLDERFARERREREEAKQAQQEAEKRAEAAVAAEIDFVTRVKAIEFFSKALLFEIYTDGHYDFDEYGQGDIRSEGIEEWLSKIDRWLNEESVGAYTTRYTLKDFAKNYLDKNQDVFDPVRKWLKKGKR